MFTIDEDNLRDSLKAGMRLVDGRGCIFFYVGANLFIDGNLNDLIYTNISDYDQNLRTFSANILDDIFEIHYEQDLLWAREHDDTLVQLEIRIAWLEEEAKELREAYVKEIGFEE